MPHFTSLITHCLHKLSLHRHQHQSAHTKTQAVVSEVTLSIKQQSGTLNDILKIRQTHYCTYTSYQAHRKSQAHFSAWREAAMSSLVNRNDETTDCQDENNDICTLQLPGTSTRSHLLRHPTGTTHYSSCQDICHWDSPLFPLPSGEATHTYTLRSEMKAVDYIHPVVWVHVISSETHTYTPTAWCEEMLWSDCHIFNCR